MLLLSGFGVSGAVAQEHPTRSAAKPATKSTAKTEPAAEKLVTTKHTLDLPGGKLEYEATAGTLVIRDEEGKALANMFFVAYTRTGKVDVTRRPLTFAYNGGPGSSAVWLHLGAFGPKRVQMKPNGEPLTPPYRLVDNEATLLDVTDLVFIDPVSTGYSRPAPGQNAKQFHGVEGDVRSVGEFIREYTSRFKRWESPKFLAGESYGTTRSAGLAGYLQDHVGMNLNGIVLVSSVLNFETLNFAEGNDLPYALFLPSYTATAWYHKKLPADLQEDFRKALAEAEQFARGEYTLALMKGYRLTEEERASVRHKLARYTGLSEDFIDRCNLRVDMGHFAKELLRKERQTVGRYDGRFKGWDLDAAGERPEYDPSYSAVQGTYTATLNHYLHTELNYEKDTPYEILTGRVQPWDYGSARNRYLNVAPTLRKAMTENPDLRVFQANGYYDLATPYFATEYTFNHLGSEPRLLDRVTMAYYRAGHMMYIDQEEHRKLKRDLAAFYEKALSR